ncbi:MAG: hypothetical protein GW946_00265 [Candidatus Pacebacteria bacterium]|nr:hypothetical protein [Candidatus Paceibacterota bacterium]PIR60250.1 MAG: hypothetical protein COU67_02915 [Candidatus Pacebacteria bacterium CG10_big_fil_rev_8_21_14_0_10_44_54]
MYESLWSFVSQSLSDIAVFFPRLLGALLIFVIGAALANGVRKFFVKILEKVRVAKMLQNTPVEHFLKNAELGHRIEDVIGSIFYWIVMLIIAQTSASVLGLESLSALLDRVLGYLPSVISAILVLFIGVLLAGLVEGLLKGTLKSVNAKSARALGKVGSYLVVIVSVMIAISELGIAREFIYILFVGFVAMISIGFGLALGLGGKNLVGKLLERWYDDISSTK